MAPGQALGELLQLNIIGHRHGLSVEETKDLWVQADIDGNAVVDYKEFKQRIWNPSWSEQRDNTTMKSKMEVLIDIIRRNKLLVLV
ncbi:hypothetical protein CCACVL1_02783 [Corchorus capsularis]|uniref:EF-hand domain-containing protein n=1 Tax=Corchorus capsularis TaxID=210143 RepID=A0A1R3K603_COCAP|nr:hypothetical protein CCACVL1_02783 [Corchorus capsularis]